jgi:nucleotide-binding universal stress UspA family protein
MSDVLAPVRLDRDTDWVAGFLIKLHQHERIRVHLLSVRSPFNGHVRMFFDEARIRAYHWEDAESELAPMRGALTAAGVPHDSHMAVGYAAEEIVRFAQSHQCPRIVVGPPKGSGVSEFVMGSLTRQIEHMLRLTGRTCEVL